MNEPSLAHVQKIWIYAQHNNDMFSYFTLMDRTSSTLSSTPRNNPSSSSTTTNDSSDLLFSASKLQPRDANYRNFYHNLFHATFRPSSGVERHLNAYFYDPVAAAVDENSNNNNNANVETEAGEKQYSSSLTPSSSKSWLPNPLRHNRYVVAHYRAKYPGEPYRETQNRTVLRETTIYAVECAKTRIGVVDAGVRRKETTSSPTTSARSSSSSSREVSAVYVASDTALVVEAARDAYPNLHNTGSKNAGTNSNANDDASVKVWTYLDLQTYDDDADSNSKGSTGNDNGNDGETIKTKNSIPLAEDPPHLNFAQPDDVSTFYSIFVDFFLMSYSNCVVHGAGGFGRMGSLVSYRPWCGIAFTAQQGVLQHCDPYD